MPGIGEEIDGAMQHAAQPSRHARIAFSGFSMQNRSVQNRSVA
jgi:hypothetical protein